jgi:hypothetical protein
MRIYQVTKNMFNKKYTILVVADDDLNIEPHFRNTAQVKKKQFMDLRGVKNQKKIVVVTPDDSII